VALLPGTMLASHGVLAQEFADTICSGGPILTIDDAQPTAEAVAVKDGTILVVATLDVVSAQTGPTLW